MVSPAAEIALSSSSSSPSSEKGTRKGKEVGEGGPSVNARRAASNSFYDATTILRGISFAYFVRISYTAILCIGRGTSGELYGE